MARSPPRLQPRPSQHEVFAFLEAAFAACSLMGWCLGLPALTRFVEGRPALSPMTAVCLLWGALGAWQVPRHRVLGRWLGVGQMLMGGAIVVCHLYGWTNSAGMPGHWWTSKLTGALFAVSGAATVLLALRHHGSGQAVASGVLMLSGLMGLGHLFPRADLYNVLPGTGVAIPTVLGLIALSLSQILACRSSGFVGSLGSRSLAGRTGRRLLFSGGAVVLAIAVLLALANQFDLLDAASAMLLIGWSAIATLGITLWGLAVAVDRAEGARKLAELARDQQRDLVTAALSQDLRSPLQAATMSAVLLQRLVNDAPAIKAVGRLQRSHRRIDRMLRSLLDTLTLDSGGTLYLRAEEVILQEVVAEVLSENSAALEGRVAPEGEAQGWWDRDAIYRVIEKLLLNAAKYGAALTPIGCRISTHGDSVRLVVENRGSPIPHARWISIFEPFQRGEKGDCGKAPGWGVGLAFAKVVAGRHGGSIGVASSDDETTVFELVLPADSRRALTSREHDPSPTLPCPHGQADDVAGVDRRTTTDLR